MKRYDHILTDEYIAEHTLTPDQIDLLERSLMQFIRDMNADHPEVEFKVDIKADEVSLCWDDKCRIAFGPHFLGMKIEEGQNLLDLHCIAENWKPRFVPQ
jgi:hypothetical protein